MNSGVIDRHTAKLAKAILMEFIMNKSILTYILPSKTTVLFNSACHVYMFESVWF